jgi:tRNA A37 threonylcarbamoyladenosine biosynthesis protein TsaE
MSNFSFLQPHWPTLFDRASRAEGLIREQPEIAVILLRSFGEMLASTAIRHLYLPPDPRDPSQADVARLQVAGVAPEVIAKFRALHLWGERASGGQSVPPDQVEALLADASSLARWFVFLVDSPLISRAVQSPPREAALDQSVNESRNWIADVTAETVAKPERETAPSRRESKSLLRPSEWVALRPEASLHGVQAPFSLRDAFTGETLTPGQDRLVDRIQDFLDDPGSQVFQLRGYAGTGKTYITMGLVKHFRAHGRSCALAAPTGRAAKVLGAKAGQSASTIHGLIYRFGKIVEYTDEGLEGSETFKKYGTLAVNNWPANTVFIVDEVSLFSDVYHEAEFFRAGSGYLLRDFLEFVGLDHNDHDKKIILIGDAAQLPPVGMNFSPALDADYLQKTYGLKVTGYELTDVVRQRAESGILRNAQPLRDAINSGVFDRVEFDFSPPDVRRIPAERILPAYFKSCDYAVNGKSVIVTRSNAAAHAYNVEVRRTFFPGKEQITSGDKLMVVANSTVQNWYFANGDFVWVKEASAETETRSVVLRRKNHETGIVEQMHVALTWRDVIVGVRNEEGEPRFLELKILENLLYNANPGPSPEEERALWQDFCSRHKGIDRKGDVFQAALREDPYINALRVKFGYAITCHKAQGSEWQHVFVDCTSRPNPLSAENFRWLYTAVTRATETLNLINPPHHLFGATKLVSPPPFAPMAPGGAPAPPTAPTLPPARSDPPVVASAPPASGFPPRPDQLSGPPDRAPASDFGVTPQHGAPYAILQLVRAALQGSGVVIEDIVHNQYQEAYLLRREGEATRVNFSYSGRGKITDVAAPQGGPLGGEMMRLLGHLRGRPVLSPGGAGQSSAGVEIRFSRPFLQEYHLRLTPIMERREIRIAAVDEKQWNLRYTFARGNEVAVMDVFFDGKNVFTKTMAVPTLSTPGALLQEVAELLTRGLSA